MQVKANIKTQTLAQAKATDVVTVIGSYTAIANEQTTTHIDNNSRTIEVKLKPHSYAQFLEFPNIGDVATIYIDESKNKAYRWSSSELKYYCIGSDYEDIDIINGGQANG